MTEELKMPHRHIHPTLNVPISTANPSSMTEVNEKTVLEMLAQDYIVNPGLYMNRDDMKKVLSDATDEKLDSILTSLEAKGLVKLHVDKKGRIALAKASYKGLKDAKPLEAYKWFPDWAKKLLNI